MKTCPLCQSEKSETAFSKDKYRQDGLVRMCKACRRNVYLQNKEKVRLQSQRWYLRNYAAANKRSIAYYVANRDRLSAVNALWYVENRDRALQNCKEYAANNRPKRAALRAKRRAQERAATPLWADHKKIEAFYQSASLFTEETGYSHEVDHIVPLVSKSVCGLHCEANLRIIPGLENRQKFNKHWPDMP